MLVFDGGGFNTFITTHYQQKQATTCSFSVVVGSASSPLPTTNENEHACLVLVVMIMEIPQVFRISALVELFP